LAKESGFSTTKHRTGWFVEYSGPCIKQLTAFSRLLLAHQPASPVDVDRIKDLETELFAHKLWRKMSAADKEKLSKKTIDELATIIIELRAEIAALSNSNKQDATPDGSTNDILDLIKFYNVSTQYQLIKAQEHHIERLQARVAKAEIMHTPFGATNGPRRG